MMVCDEDESNPSHVDEWPYNERVRQQLGDNSIKGEFAKA